MIQDTATFSFNPPGGTDDRSRLQMAPLIDIVFLLICFYLFVADLIKQQKDMTVELPVMKCTLSDEEMPSSITINLREDGQLNVNGEMTPAIRLLEILNHHRRQTLDAGDPLRVTIRADHRQDFDRLDKVLQDCKRAGLKTIIFRSITHDEQ